MLLIDWDALCYSSACFVSALFVLEYGADKFIDHTALVAERLGVSQTFIALLTAGAEYEELAVIIAAVLQNRNSLALGNIMGSTISNILGAFSLALLVHPGRMDFDRSARFYTTILLGVTTMATGLTWAGQLNRITGSILLVTFALYLLTIGYAIYRGVVDAPDRAETDSDSDSDSGSDADSVDVESSAQHLSETSRLLGEGEEIGRHHGWSLSLAYHIVQLVIGFVCLSLSGYVLARSATTMAETLNLSGTVVGFTVVSLATTLPEKLVAVLGGSRGHSGIVIANTAGSNIFLLTLCVGIVAVAGGVNLSSETVSLFEMASVWGSSALLAAVVYLRLGRWMGVVLLAAYIGFLVLELTVYRR
ncbi:hypothetical protein FE257_004404 [Aspergillus nanangensis]|uniref:Sodium/calcium exchanger membrane region domain-containing protein n=1 Tax=Aspergillus nanangensis TaxID=2582783 RepID=A0AAD4CZP7_ASPNN|nr:hypothetical protein FE257_004404 [Aspergillus nanangensis]